MFILVFYVYAFFSSFMKVIDAILQNKITDFLRIPFCQYMFKYQTLDPQNWHINIKFKPYFPGAMYYGLRSFYKNFLFLLCEYLHFYNSFHRKLSSLTLCGS